MNKWIKKLFRLEVLALLMSFFAIWATYHQNQTNQEFYMLSVKPLLKSNLYIAPDLVGMSVENYGLGVALIDSIQITQHAKPVSTQDIASQLSGIASSTNVSAYSTSSSEMMLREDEQVHLFAIRDIDAQTWDGDTFNGLSSILSAVEITVYFRDLYDNSYSKKLTR